MKTEVSSNNILSRFANRAVSSEIGRGLILAIPVGVIAGFGAIAFRWLIISFQRLSFGELAGALGFLGEYYVILLPAIGGLFVGLIIYYGAREAKGHGVPEVMEAVALRGGRIRPRVAIIKALASSICIGSGGSVGREGPIVQIGSSFGSTLGQRLKLSDDWVRTLVACGAAGGIAATFNAPIGGAFFAHEVILGRFVTPKFGFVIISSVVASVISRVFLGDRPSFDIVPYTMVSNWELLPYALLGVISALVAVAFVRVLYKAEDLFDAWHIPQWIKPAIGGIGIGLIGLYSFDLLGVGYGKAYWISSMSIDQALAGGIAVQSLIILLVLKLVATSLTLGSGGSGGVFAPSLFIGAMLGGAFGILTHHLFPSITAPSGAYALVGMAAVFAGAARAPITAIIILFEMTADYKIIIPLMVAVVISTVITQNMSRESIYTLKLVRRGVDTRGLEERSPLRTVTAAQVMTQNYPTILPETPVNDLIARLRKTGHHGFLIADAVGNLQGVVTISDVEAAMAEGDIKDLTAADIATKNLITAYPDQPLHDVLVKLGAREVGRIPVVDRNNPKRLLGALRRSDIIRAYTKGVRRKPAA